MTPSRSLTVAALLLASACAPNYQPLLITGVFPPDDLGTNGGCLSGKPTIAQYAGSLNVGVGPTELDSYYVVLTLDSLLQDDPISPTSNTTMLNQIQYKYTASPGPAGTPVGFPVDETATLSFAVKAASVDNLLLVDLIGPEAKRRLLGVQTANEAEYFTLKVEVQFSGTTLANTAVRSNSASFPIDIYNQAFPCPSGSILKPTGPCGNSGQDHSPLVCCVPDAATGLCKP